MLTLLFLFSSSFLLTVAITPAVRNLAIRIGWVDVPDRKRKIHTRPIPRVGGIAVFLVYVAALIVLAVTPLDERIQESSWALAWRLLPAAAVVFLTGLLDDRFGLSPWQKLAGHIVAAGMAWLAGVRIEGLVWRSVDPWIGLPLTVLWLVACTNAFNLIDGMDGLAAGIGLFATLTTMTAGLLHGDWGLALATAPLAGALAGFLRFNFNPASVFLGDAGSLSVGFLLGCFSVIWSHKSSTILGMTAPLMALAVPILETAISVVRRFLGSKPIFGADRAHIHHRLLDLGLAPRRVVVLLYLASGTAACFALLQSFVSNELRGLVLLAFCAAAWMSIQRLGYREFKAVADLLQSRLLRGLLNERLQVRVLEDSLGAAATPNDRWRAIQEGARHLGFTSVALHHQGNLLTAELNTPQNGQWSVTVPLSGRDYIRLTRELDSAQMDLALTPFIDFIHRVLCEDGTQPVEQPGVRAMAASSGGQRKED